MRTKIIFAFFLCYAFAQQCNFGDCCEPTTMMFKAQGTLCGVVGDSECGASYCSGMSNFCPQPVIVQNKPCSLNGQQGVCNGTTCVVSEGAVGTVTKTFSSVFNGIKNAPSAIANRGQKAQQAPSDYDKNPLLNTSMDDEDFDDEDDEDDDDEEEDTVKTEQTPEAVPCKGDCCNLISSGAKPNGSLCGRGGVCQSGECINQKCIGSCCQWMSDEALADGAVCGHNGKCSKGVCINQQCLGECCSMWGWSDEPLDDGTPCSNGRCVSGICVATNYYTTNNVAPLKAQQQQRVQQKPQPTKQQPQQRQQQQTYQQQAYQPTYQQQAFQPTYQQAYQQTYQQPTYQMYQQPTYQQYPNYQQNYQQNYNYGYPTYNQAY